MADLVQMLVEHVERGELLDLAPGEVIDEAAMRGWGLERTVPASAIRDVLRGRRAEAPDPRGLRLRGALITGSLDLEKLTTDVTLELGECYLAEGLIARGARIPGIALESCLIEHPDKSPMDAAGLTTSNLDLRGTIIRGSTESGSVILRGAHIGGQLDCDGASFQNDIGPALQAEMLKVDQHVLLRGINARGSGTAGTVCLLGAHIGGSLNCAGAELENSAGPALNADGVQVGQHVLLRNGFDAEGSGEIGVVVLAAASIGGVLSCEGAQIRSSGGPALRAANLQVNRSVSMTAGFDARGSGDAGTVHLLGAHIGGSLNCAGAKIHNATGPALNADSLQVDQHVLLRNGFTAEGSGEAGAVRIPSANIGGQLNCNGAKLRNESGPALNGESIRIGTHALFREGFAAHGSGETGSVSLAAANIGGTLNCEGATLFSATGPALNVDTTHIEQHAMLHAGFKAYGSGGRGAVRLASSRISGTLCCHGADLINDSGPALHAENLQVGHHFRMNQGFKAKGDGENATLNLKGAKVGGSLVFSPTKLEHSNLTRRLALEQLEYSGLPEGSWQVWLDLLRVATPEYTAQPYQQLAAAHRAAGHDRDTRTVLIAQRRDQLRRASSSTGERLWGWATGLSLGYGYQPWRALIALVGVVMISVLLCSVGPGGRGGLAHPPKSGSSTPCSVVERIGVGIEFGLPLIKTGARSRCDTTETANGQRLTAAGWGLQVLAWAFASLFVAGFTGAVRKT